MFDKNEVDRLSAWHEFRDQLEVSENPLQDTIDLYNTCPITSFSMDPYNSETWPNPWELLSENTYCNFGIILGISYTLMLTDRFSHSFEKITINTNKEVAQTKYLLYIDNKVIGYDRKTWLTVDAIDNTNWIVESTIQLPSYQ